MPLKDIQKRLEERFSTPLSDFYERRIIFWKDEDREFEPVFDKLELDNVRKIKLDGSNSFEVKKMLQADDTTGNYLVYSPLAYEKSEDNWLLNVELYSEEFRADLTSMRMASLNVEDTEMLRKAVRTYSKFFDSKERENALRKLSNHYESPTSLHLNVMAVLTGASSGSVVAILQSVLVDELDIDSNTGLQKIAKYGNLAAFWQMIDRYTGYPSQGLDIDGDEPSVEELARFLLVSALVMNFDMAALKGLESYISDSKNGNCYSIVHEWMTAGDKEAYQELANHVEGKMHLRPRFEKADITALLGTDIFPGVDEVLLRKYFDEISENIFKVEDILTAVDTKRTQAWFTQYKPFYDALNYAAKMQNFHIKYNDGFHFTTPVDLWKFYEDEAYLMDTWYRKFQVAYQDALQENNEYLEDSLRQAADVIEALYTNWFLSGMMENWVKVSGDDFTELGYVSSIPKQREFYTNQISRQNKKTTKRSVVIISDALRYEVAAELRDQLVASTNGTAELSSRQAAFPSITKFGMPSLLNCYNPSIIISNGSPEVLIDGVHVRSTAEREKRLQTSDGVQCLKAGAIQAEDYKDMKSKDRRSYLKDKDTVYIYHNKVDATGDKAPTEKDVFYACDKAIDELSALIKTLVNDKVSEIFVTADHGFLYTANPLKEMNKVSRDVLSQDAYECGRRYILAPEGTTAEYLLPVNMTGEFKGERLIGFTPRDTSRIKISGGGENFVHGGISLQELMIPVIQFHNKTRASKDFTERELAKIQLLTEKHKISNLMFSLSFYQPVPVGDKVLPAVYQIYMEDEDGNTVSDVREVIADFDSPNNIDRQARVRFNLKPGQYDRKKTYKLIISNGQDIPVEENFTIDIAMADDFGFDF